MVAVAIIVDSFTDFSVSCEIVGLSSYDIDKILTIIPANPITEEIYAKSTCLLITQKAYYSAQTKQTKKAGKNCQPFLFALYLRLNTTLGTAAAN